MTATDTKTKSQARFITFDIRLEEYVSAGLEDWLSRMKNHQPKKSCTGAAQTCMIMVTKDLCVRPVHSAASTGSVPDSKTEGQSMGVHLAEYKHLALTWLYQLDLVN